MTLVMKRLLCILLAGSLMLSLPAKTRKSVYIIIDGVPADQIERLQPPAIFDIASHGGYARAYTGGDVGEYSQTPTISAVGYTNLLTATWYNKHNVGGNDNLSPNYNYWTVFRIAEEQDRDVVTGLYSSWSDNRTVLIGEGRPETGNLRLDIVRDGYDHDPEAFPAREKSLEIFDIDEKVSEEAAASIRKDAPDLSWVYLWYTDDAGHIEGNGKYFDEYVMKADAQVKRIWDAVRYREENFDEEWMVIVTTDHGRGNDGYGHGGQSERERTTWISVNRPVNRHFYGGCLSITDIAPTICRYMDFRVPRDVLWEQDGMSFIGNVDIYDFRIMPYDNSAVLSWKSYSREVPVPVSIYVACDNKFSQGGKDEWTKLADVPSTDGTYTVDLSGLPESKFYKFVLKAPSNHLNRWLLR